MSTDLLDFWWPVCDQGYRWFDAFVVFPEGRIGRFVFENNPERTGETRTTQPLIHFPALHRWFAEVEPTEEGVVDFANRFGLLGGDVGIGVVLDQRDKDTVMYGESLKAWRNEINAMRDALHLWNAIQARDITALRQCIRLRNDEAALVTIEHRVQAVWTDAHPLPATSPSTVDDSVYVAIAQAAVRTSINKHFGRRTSPRLICEPGGSQSRICLVPDCLIAALWAQFALAVDGCKVYRRCENCAQWIDASPSKTRKTRKYCSSACRQGAYRQRNAQIANGTRQRSVDQ